MLILIVEDDIQLAEILTEALTDHQYVVEVVENGELAWEAVQVIDYDLILLDLTLPKLDGISFCQRLRQNQYSLPILMLTARDTLADKITGLDAGADDYMVKPFEIEELMARIRVLLRRVNSTKEPDLSWGSLHLNSSTYEVTYDQQLLHLTPKEYALLELLVSNGRRVLSRSHIIEHIWSVEAHPSGETVKSHLKSLRQKLREVGAPDDFIETVYGLGYRLKTIDN